MCGCDNTGKSNPVMLSPQFQLPLQLLLRILEVQQLRTYIRATAAAATAATAFAAAAAAAAAAITANTTITIAATTATVTTTKRSRSICNHHCSSQYLGALGTPDWHWIAMTTIALAFLVDINSQVVF
jgi:hypothetical protein